MIIKKSVVANFLLALMASSILPAADFYYDLCGGSKSGAECIHIDGAIRPGDSQGFIEFILKDPKRFSQAIAIQISSLGGDIEEAISLAKLVKASCFRTQIDYPSKCASACFLLYAAGNERGWFSNQESKLTTIGLHRPYLEKDEVKELSLEALDKKNKTIAKTVRSLMHEWDIPEKIVDIMFSTSSVDVRWLTYDEYQEIRAVQTAWEESVIGKCDINDPRIRCTLFNDCPATSDYIEDFYSNEKYAAYPTCRVLYRLDMTLNFVSNLKKQKHGEK